MQLVQGTGGDALVRREIKNGLGGFVVTCDGDAIAWGEAVEERVDSL